MEELLQNEINRQGTVCHTCLTPTSSGIKTNMLSLRNILKLDEQTLTLL